MKKDEIEDLADELRPEYDFSGGVRGKYADAMSKDAVIVILDPDVAAAFPDTASVNRTLRAVLAERQRH